MAVPRILDSLRGAATEAGGALLGRLQHVRLPGVGQSSSADDPETAARRWRAVTVLRSPEQIGTGADLPAPLAALGDRVEVRVTPAPGDRGAELAARYRDLRRCTASATCRASSTTWPAGSSPPSTWPPT